MSWPDRGRADAGKARRPSLITGFVRRMQAAFCWKARKSSEEKAGGSAKFTENTDGIPDPAGFFDQCRHSETRILEAGIRNEPEKACLHLPELLKKWNLVRKRRCAIPRETSGGESQRARNCAGSCCAAVSSDLRRGNECAPRAAVQGADRSTAEKTAAGRRTCDAVDRPRPCAGNSAAV